MSSEAQEVRVRAGEEEYDKQLEALRRELEDVRAEAAASREAPPAGHTGEPALTDADLAAIEARWVAPQDARRPRRAASTRADVARLLAEVRRLRDGIATIIATHRPAAEFADAASYAACLAALEALLTEPSDAATAAAVRGDASPIPAAGASTGEGFPRSMSETPPPAPFPIL